MGAANRTLRPRWNAAKHAVAPWCGEMLQVVAKNAIRDLGRAVDKLEEPQAPRSLPEASSAGAGARRCVSTMAPTRCASKAAPACRQLGCIRMREALRFEGRILGAVVSRTAQRWFVSVTVEDGVDLPGSPQAAGAIGVDVGIMTLAACSDGVTYENPKAHEAAVAQAAPHPEGRCPLTQRQPRQAAIEPASASAWRTWPASMPASRTCAAMPTTRRARPLWPALGPPTARWSPRI